MAALRASIHVRAATAVEGVQGALSGLRGQVYQTRAWARTEVGGQRQGWRLGEQPCKAGSSVPGALWPLVSGSPLCFLKMTASSSRAHWRAGPAAQPQCPAYLTVALSEPVAPRPTAASLAQPQTEKQWHLSVC